jgi:chemotaxis protein MotB
MSAKAQPIIVIKKKGGHDGHHGGAWKVAYADFVTALMALFIVLWLLNQSVQVRKAVAGYFNDPKGTASQLGTTMSGNGVKPVTQPDENTRKLEELKQKLEQAIQARKDLEKLVKQIEITITPEGLRIELLEEKNGTFYQSGSAQLSGNGQELLALLAGELKTLPNKLLIEGHTDAAQYSTNANYSNWELSADRANAARRLLQQDGVGPDQVTQVRGYADQLLRVKSNPYDPSNRRITILVKNLDGSALPPQLAHARIQMSGAPSKNSGNEPAGVKHQVTPSSPAPPGKPSPPALKPGVVSTLTSLLPRAKK